MTTEASAPTVALVHPEAYGPLSAVGARVSGFRRAFEAAGWQVVALGDGRRGPSYFETVLEPRLPRVAQTALRRLGVQGQIQPISGLRAHRRCSWENADAVVCTVPPISFSALVSTVFRQRPVILDYRDAWGAAEHPSALARVSRPVERVAIARAWAVTFAGGAAFGQQLASLATPRSGRIVAVPNGIDRSDLPQAPPPAKRQGEPLALVIAGQLYGNNVWESVAKALASLPAGVATLEIIGDQPSYVREWFAVLGNAVRWTPGVGRRRLYERLAQADAGLVVVTEDDAWRTRIPVKVYEYRACGLAVIAACPPTAAVLEAAPDAHRVDPGDRTRLAALLRSAWADRAILRRTRPPVEVFDRASAAGALVRLACDALA